MHLGTICRSQYLQKRPEGSLVGISWLHVIHSVELLTASQILVSSVWLLRDSKTVSSLPLCLQADLALFYVKLPKGLGRIGERWDDSSYLQALGFVILVVGTLVYGRGDEEQEHKHVSMQL